jgi:hypothetical protein
MEHLTKGKFKFLYNFRKVSLLFKAEKLILNCSFSDRTSQQPSGITDLESAQEQPSVQSLQLGIVEQGFQIGSGEGVGHSGHVRKVHIIC